MKIGTESGFDQVLAEHFPGTIPVDDFFNQTARLLDPYGFNDDNTLGTLQLAETRSQHRSSAPWLNIGGEPSAAEV